MEKELRERFTKQGFSFDIWSDKPGAEWRNFVHDTDELVVLLEGNVEFVVDGEIYHPQIGEELLIKAGQIHDAVNNGAVQNCWAYGYK